LHGLIIIATRRFRILWMLNRARRLPRSRYSCGNDFITTPRSVVKNNRLPPLALSRKYLLLHATNRVTCRLFFPRSDRKIRLICHVMLNARAPKAFREFFSARTAYT